MSAGIDPLHGRTSNVLSQADVEAIHDTTIRVLQEIGVEFQSEEALEIFRQNADVSVDGSRVRLSPRLVEWAIVQAPGKFFLRARNPDYDVPLGRNQVCYTSAYGATFICDSETQVYRKATLDDVADYSLLADALENVHYVLTPAIPQDFSPSNAELFAAAILFSNTQKHVGIGVPTPDYLDDLWEMGRLVAEAAGVEAPVYSLGATVNSPLVYTREMVPKMIHAARRTIPLRISSGALAGATAPVTLAGTLVVQNAEILAGITLCQLVNPGCPMVYATLAGGTDMRTGKWAASGPELSLLTSASAQLCRMYDIPLGYGTGGVADSRVPDVRAGLEKGLTTLSAALCGVEVIHDGVSGLIAGGMALSFEQLVIDNEIAKWINHFLCGIRVGENELAFDVIKSVGPGGQFLDQEHTVRLFKKEHFISPILSRSHELKWPDSQDQDIVTRARHRVQGILSNHRPPELDDGVKSAIQDILVRIGGEHVIL